MRNKINFGSDSLSSLKALESFQVQSKTNPHLIEFKKDLLDATEAHQEIRLVWIPAHIGLIDNERADQLAKEMAKSSALPDRTYSIPYTDVIRKSADFIREKITNEWRRQVEDKNTRLAKIKTKPGPPWFQRIEAPRKLITSSKSKRTSP